MKPMDVLRLAGDVDGRIGATTVTRTDEGPSPFQSFLFGWRGIATKTFTVTKIGAKAGDTGFGVSARVCVYEESGGQNLLGYGELTGGFSALELRTGLLTTAPFIVNAGVTYLVLCQMSGAGGWLATSADSLQYALADANYGDGPPATAAGYFQDGGVNRCSYCFALEN